MKEIEEQILARKDELNTAAPKKKKKEEAAADPAEKSAAEVSEEAASNEDVLANFDEEFDEFTPAEE